MVADFADETWPLLVTLPAEIDTNNAAAVRSKITTVARNPCVSAVIVDMTATTFCDSTGVRALLEAHQEAARNGSDLRLVRPSRSVRRVLELMGVDHVLAIYENFGDAMASELSRGDDQGIPQSGGQAR